MRQDVSWQHEIESELSSRHKNMIAVAAALPECGQQGEESSNNRNKKHLNQISYTFLSDDSGLPRNMVTKIKINPGNKY